MFRILNDGKHNNSENTVSMKREVHGVYTEQVRFKNMSAKQ